MPRFSGKMKSVKTYDNSRHSQSDGEGGSGLLLASESRVKVLYATEKDDVTARVLPALHPDDPGNRFAPARLTVGTHGQSEHTILAPAAEFAGDKERETWCLYHPDTPDDEKRRNPYVVLYWAAKRACDSGRWGNNKKWNVDWNPLVKRSEGGGNKGPGLARPGRIGLQQVACLVHGQKNYVAKGAPPFGLGKDDPLVVLKTKSSACEALLTLLDTPKEGVEPEDFEKTPNKAFRYNLVGVHNRETGQVTGGYFEEYYRSGPKLAPGDISTWDGEPPDNKLGIYVYHFNLHKQFKVAKGQVLTPDLDPDQVKVALSRVQPWWDYVIDETTYPGLIRVMPYEEQAALVARLFKRVAPMVLLAWEDYPEYRDLDEVQGILASRVSTIAPSDDDDVEDEDDADAEDEDEEDEEDDAPPRRQTKTSAALPPEDVETDDEDADDADAAAAGDPDYAEDEDDTDAEYEAEDDADTEEEDDADADAEDDADADAEADAEDEEDDVPPPPVLPQKTKKDKLGAAVRKAEQAKADALARSAQRAPVKGKPPAPPAKKTAPAKPAAAAKKPATTKPAPAKKPPAKVAARR